jgi:glutaredoxin
MVTIYTMQNCPYCADLKELLTTENIEFNDIDIFDKEHEKEVNDIMEVSKAQEVPIIRVEKQLFIPNVSFKSITEAVELTKKFIG